MAIQIKRSKDGSRSSAKVSTTRTPPSRAEIPEVSQPASQRNPDLGRGQLIRIEDIALTSTNPLSEEEWRNDYEHAIEFTAEGHYREAEEIYDRTEAHILNGKYEASELRLAQLYYNRARNFDEWGKLQQAETYFVMADTYQPHDFETAMALTSVTRRLQEYDRAEVWCRRAIAISLSEQSKEAEKYLDRVIKERRLATYFIDGTGI